MSDQLMNQSRPDRQEAICEAPEMTGTDARNAMERLRREASDTPELSLDEINAEIKAAREERKARG